MVDRFILMIKRVVVPSLLLIPLFSLQAFGSVESVDDSSCRDCHEERVDDLRGSAHQLSDMQIDNVIDLSCISCHRGGDRHQEDPTLDNISNPARSIGLEAVDVCLACHQPHEQRQNSEFDVHSGLDLSCSSCHSVHQKKTSFRSDKAAGLCGDCHTGVMNSFRLRSNHPIADGVMNCLSCHNIGGNIEANLGHGANSNCTNCHPEHAGPFLSEHNGGSSFVTEGDGCISCHDPHGSPNERLLKQPTETLCMQCHGVPALHTVAHKGQYAGFACYDCHSEVHGTLEPKNRYLLDPNLGSKLGGSHLSCYCHNVGN